MILSSVTPDISWIVPWSVLQQLCHLWRGFGMVLDAKERVYLSGEQLGEAGLSVEYDVFQLLIEAEFTALLWAQPYLKSEEAESELSCYEVFVSFDPEAIAPLIHSLTQSQIESLKLTAFHGNKFPHSSALPPNMMVELLEIVRSPSIRDIPSDQPPLPNQPLHDLLNQRLEQEKILNNVTHRIYQNQDLMMTVRMALEQAQRLLRVDRLLVYQMDLPTEDPTVFGSRVTFEVLSSLKIASLLNFAQDECLESNQRVKNAYLGGKHFALTDIETDPHLIDCFKKQLRSMQVRAEVVVPLIVENRLWGLLIAHQCHAPRRWRKNEITFLNHVAEYLAIAIIQARSYKQLQEQKSNLENLAKQRSKELEEALLSAQIASQSKKEFIHIMSHELLTPLTSIIGLSNTLSYWSSAENKNKLPPEKQRTYLQTIHESGLKLRNLLQDILDFSQTEAARSVLDIQQFSLKQLCLMMMDVFQEISSRQGLSLKFINRLEPEQDIFYADPIRIEKILTNLLSNAIKFTSDGGEVHLTVWREGLKDVIFQVKDTGIGIPTQQMPLLFQQFQQLEPTMSRSYDGAGFGLALVKQLVDIHQGKIQVASTPQKGSTFTVRIPSQTKGTLHPVSKGTVGGNQGGTVVLISQDEEVATLICDLLTATNYQVIWLIDSAIAIDQITVLQPVLVIVDAEQNKISSKEIIGELKNSPRTQRIQALLIGDRLEDQEWQQLHKQGFQDYLEKPVQSEILIDIVNHYVMHHYAAIG